MMKNGSITNDLYAKTVSIGALPNTSRLDVPHGIPDLLTIYQLYGTAISQTSGTTVPLPTIGTTLDENITLTVNGTNVVIITGSNRSNLDGVVTLVYTKSS